MSPGYAARTELNSTVSGTCSKTAVCLYVLTLAVNPFGKVLAQEAGDKGFVLEEIVVTARKFEENLQVTPIAVSAISGDSLRERDLTQITGVAEIAPNVNFSFGGTSSGSGSAAVVYIRGVGQNDFTPVTEPGVGIYVDGVYLGRSIGSVLDVLDLERIEVLRGPQGTLFGRNSIGGAISLISRDPGDKFAGRVRVTLGEDSRQEFFGSVDVPFNSQLRATISALSKRRDGYVDRLLTGAKLGDDDVLGARAKLVWDATEDLSLKLSVDGVREREQSAPEVAIAIDGTAGFLGFFNDPPFPTLVQAASDCSGGGSLSNPDCANAQWEAGHYASNETGPSINDIDNWGVSFTLDWSIGAVNLKSITAYRDLKADFARSADGTPFPVFQTTDDYEQDQFSQEFQITGVSFDERLRWTGGLYYFEEAASDVGLIEGVPPPFPFVIGGETDNDTFAVYGEATFDATDRLHLTAGLRYTDETKRFSPIAEALALNLPPLPPFQILAPGERSIDISEITYRATVAYDLADSVMGYFTVSEGFKSGGFVIRTTTPRPDPATFEPEFVTLFEAGLKADFPDIGLRLNAAAFFSDYEDIQVAANPPGEIGTVTANAADGEIKGVELEFTYVPASALLISGALGYQDAQYTKVNPNANVTVTLNDEFIRTPEWSWNLGTSYLLELGNGGSLTPRLDWVYKAETHFEPANNVLVAQDAYHVLNVSATYRDSTEKWRVALGVNNLTDEDYLIAADSNGAIGYALGVFSRPRNWYLSVERAFE